MSIKVAVPKETAEGERRVAIESSVIAKLAKLGAEVLVETGAGDAAHIPDTAFIGAIMVATANDLYQQADIVLKVQPPSDAEIAQLKAGSVLIGMLQPYQSPERIAALNAKNITSFAMELIPRISRAQAMDV